MPTWEQWDRAHLAAPRLAAQLDGKVVGWAALTPVSTRPVYAGVAEASIYIASANRGVGIGQALTRQMLEASEQAGIWTLQAAVFPENEASLALLRWAGFRLIGRRERLGQLHGVWRDVLLYERRSQVVGR